MLCNFGRGKWNWAFPPSCHSAQDSISHVQASWPMKVHLMWLPYFLHRHQVEKAWHLPEWWNLSEPNKMCCHSTTEVLPGGRLLLQQEYQIWWQQWLLFSPHTLFLINLFWLVIVLRPQKQTPVKWERLSDPKLTHYNMIKFRPEIVWDCFLHVGYQTSTPK